MLLRAQANPGSLGKEAFPRYRLVLRTSPGEVQALWAKIAQNAVNTQVCTLCVRPESQARSRPKARVLGVFC